MYCSCIYLTSKEYYRVLSLVWFARLLHNIGVAISTKLWRTTHGGCDVTAFFWKRVQLSLTSVKQSSILNCARTTDRFSGWPDNLSDRVCYRNQQSLLLNFGHIHITTVREIICLEKLTQVRLSTNPRVTALPLIQDIYVCVVIHCRVTCILYVSGSLSKTVPFLDWYWFNLSQWPSRIRVLDHDLLMPTFAHFTFTISVNQYVFLWIIQRLLIWS